MNHTTKQNLLPVQLDQDAGATTPPTRVDVEL